MIKTDKVVYRIRTQKEFFWIIDRLDEARCKWAGGSFPASPKQADNWNRYYIETCINCENEIITFADFDFYKNDLDYKDYEFIEVSDLMETEKETDTQDKTEEETDALEELEAIHKQLTSQIGDLRKQGKEPKAIEYTIKVCFE